MDSQVKNSVLVVDDMKVTRAYLHHILSAHYTTYTAGSALEAIEKANEFLPDLILLDILMPGTDGYEALARLKAAEKTKDIPVIFITSLNSQEDERKGLALGADDYITKPFSDEIVRLKVRNQLKIINQMRALDRKIKERNLMASIPKSFLNADKIDTLLTDTLRAVGEFLDLGQILLFKLDDDQTSLICQNEWLRPELKLPTRIGSELALQESIRSAILKLKKSEEDVYLLPIEPFFKAPMAPYRADFKNFITKPIFNRGKMCAVLDFARGDNRRDWDESESSFAAYVASVFSGVFERDAMGRQSAIIENTPSLILYLDEDGGVEYVNPAVTGTTGYTSREILDGGLNTIFDESSVRDIVQNRIPRASPENTGLFDINMICRNGQIKELTVSLFTTGKSNFTIVTKDVKGAPHEFAVFS